MNILDLKKGEKVFVGINRGGSGFPTSAFCAEEVNIRDIVLYTKDGKIETDVRVQWLDYVQTMSSARGEFIYDTKEDFFDDVRIAVPNRHEILDFISNITGFTRDSKSTMFSFFYWVWDESKKIAVKKEWLFEFARISLFNLPVPNGAYPTKEACEKANRKTIKMAVHKTFTRFIDVEADTIKEAEEWIDEHFENECDPVNNPDIIGDYYTEPVNDD